jgi:hypothetical protein
LGAVPQVQTVMTWSIPGRKARSGWAHMRGLQLKKDDVGLVDDDDLAGFFSGAKLRGACAVVALAGGIHQMNQPLETKAIAALLPAVEARRERLHLLQRRPEEPPGQLRIALAIGVGKTVAARRLRSPNGLPPVRDEARRGGQLGVEQRQPMAPRRERTRLLPASTPFLLSQFLTSCGMPVSATWQRGKNGAARRQLS